jgi:hypothetical protein
VTREAKIARRHVYLGVSASVAAGILLIATAATKAHSTDGERTSQDAMEVKQMSSAAIPLHTEGEFPSLVTRVDGR